MRPKRWNFHARIPQEEGDDTDFKNLSPELREKAKACNTPEELLALAKKEGYKLSEEELDLLHFIVVHGQEQTGTGFLATMRSRCSSSLGRFTGIQRIT